MLAYFRKIYETLLLSVVVPICVWVLAMSFAKRLLILLAISAGIAFWLYPSALKNGAAYSGRLLRVATTDPGAIPLEKTLHRGTAEARRRLLAASINDANLISTGEITGWSAAQSLLAIGQQGKLNSDEEQFFQHIRASRLQTCSCWPELNGDDEKRAWTFVSGWVLAALARKHIPASNAELGFLLDQQNPDGSWASIPTRDVPQFASVYATSWSLIGLLNQLDAGLVADQARARQARLAVKRGAAWLLNKRQAEARWKPYPNLQSSSISGSISGLAMHALHMAVPEQMAAIDKAWLDNLPASPVPASLGEHSYVEIKHGGTRQIDHFVQLTMPWMLIGTVDAYPAGDIFQRTRALTWIEQTLSQESVRNADAEHTNWWRAELLIAMNHLDSRIAPSRGQK
jgi:hypothetical protein